MAATLQLTVGDEPTYLLLAISQIEQALRVSGGLSTTAIEVPTVALSDQANALVIGTELINFNG